MRNKKKWIAAVLFSAAVTVMGAWTGYASETTIFVDDLGREVELTLHKDNPFSETLAVYCSTTLSSSGCSAAC